MVEQLRRHRDSERRTTGLDPASGGGRCVDVDCIYAVGPLTGGSLSIEYSLDPEETGTPTVESVALDHNENKTDAKTKILAALSQVASDDIVVFGGPLPSTALYIRWTGKYASKSVPIPVATDNTVGNYSSAHVLRIAARDWGSFE